MLLPLQARPLLAAFLPHFSHARYTRYVTLMAAASLTPGRRTVANAVELKVGERLGICDVRMHLLPEGYRFSLADRTPLPPDIPAEPSDP
jgi:cyanophycinase-like exopeptidase